MAERDFVYLAFDTYFNGYSIGLPRHIYLPDISIAIFIIVGSLFLYQFCK